MNLNLTVDALGDIHEISRFARKAYGKAQAKWYIGQMEHHCHALAQGRLRGRPAAHIAENLRKQRVESHFVFFKIEGSELVVRVLHEAMNHESYLPIR